MITRWKLILSCSNWTSLIAESIQLKWINLRWRVKMVLSVAKENSPFITRVTTTIQIFPPYSVFPSRNITWLNYQIWKGGKLQQSWKNTMYKGSEKQSNSHGEHAQNTIFIVINMSIYGIDFRQICSVLCVHLNTGVEWKYCLHHLSKNLLAINTFSNAYCW